MDRSIGRSHEELVGVARLGFTPVNRKWGIVKRPLRSLVRFAVQKKHANKGRIRPLNREASPCAIDTAGDSRLISQLIDVSRFDSVEVFRCFYDFPMLFQQRVVIK